MQKEGRKKISVRKGQKMDSKTIVIWRRIRKEGEDEWGQDEQMKAIVEQ
jgi:hypothetical protein